jgi:hypothetical protein
MWEESQVTFLRVMDIWLYWQISDYEREVYDLGGQVVDDFVAAAVQSPNLEQISTDFRPQLATALSDWLTKRSVDWNIIMDECSTYVFSSAVTDLFKQYGPKALTYLGKGTIDKVGFGDDIEQEVLLFDTDDVDTILGRLGEKNWHGKEYTVTAYKGSRSEYTGKLRLQRNFPTGKNKSFGCWVIPPDGKKALDTGCALTITKENGKISDQFLKMREIHHEGMVVDQAIGLSLEARRYIEGVAIDGGKVSMRESTEAFNAIKRNLREFLEVLKGDVIEHLEKGSEGTLAATGTLTFPEYMSYKSLLESKFLYSRSIEETTSEMTDIIEDMWKRSRLPNETRAEALYLLRTVWNSVDNYWNEARIFKYYAKMLFRMFVLCALAISVVTVVYLNDNTIITQPQCNAAVLVLSLIASLVSASIAFFQPERRWLTFRAASLTLESEIWNFRMSFAINCKQDSRDQEESLRAFQKAVQEQVSKSASTGTTTINTDIDLFGYPEQFQREVCIHGQYDDRTVSARMPGVFYFLPSCLGNSTWLNRCCSKGRRRTFDREDDHHTALDPEEYIRWRVKPVVMFYQNRLPHYYKKLQFMETLMIAGQVTGMLMSAFQLAHWTTIVTAAVATVTAWRSYAQIEKKLMRYSNTVEKINTIIPWWEQLDPIEKSSAANIQHLVETCEQVFKSEWDSWTSTSMRLQKMAKKTNDQNNAEEKKDQ